MVFHHKEGFFKTTANQYGYESVLLLKSWIKTSILLITASQQLTFLLRCRRHDVLPSHIYNLRCNISFRSSKVSHFFDNSRKRHQSRLLNLEIKDLNFCLIFLRNKLHNIEQGISSLLPSSLVSDFFSANKHRLINHTDRIKLKLINKFNLIQNKRNPLLKIDTNKWVVNDSNCQIPFDILKILSLGDKFSPPIDTSNTVDRLKSTLQIVKNFEINSFKISTDSFNEVRVAIVNVLSRFLTLKRHLNYIDKYIIDNFNKCKRFLLNNDNILVTKADKGQITVILDKQTYTQQMTDTLNDTDTYKKLNKNPNKTITTKIQELIKAWLDSGIIDKFTYTKLRCTNGNLPRCYGLPKIHKPGHPLRIIVSTVGSAPYGIAKFLCDILEESVPKPNSYIKDSWSFARIIRNITIQPDEVLVSFDVVSLFTNIPINLVLDAIENRWSDICNKTTLNLQQFLHAVKLILTSTCFCFNSIYYEQIFGTPMGSPLSPILADLVLFDLEYQCLKTLQFDIKYFYRYVDDIFLILPKMHVYRVLEHFNNYHPRLKFTCELESNNRINFLDLTIIRESDRLITNWYHKPTFSGRYVNYYSHHPHNYKVNIVTGLIDRAVLLSDERFHTPNINIVKKILTNNCYPLHLINKIIRKRLKDLKAYVNRTNMNSLTVRRNPIVIPYIKNCSEKIFHILKAKGFDTVYSIHKKLDVFIKKGKDMLGKLNQTEIIYKVNCNDCDKSYIGQTKRHLQTRINEHRTNIKKHPSNHSVISKHRISCDHDFDWSNPSILHKEKHLKKREVAEMFLIKKNKNSINLQTDTENLSKTYDRILRIV